ncbi:MAG: twin-arginine translocase subunit TatC [Gammaproteobacteria bacterium]
MTAPLKLRDDAPAPDEVDLARAPLLSHLLEFRRRLLLVLAFFVLTSAASYLAAEELFGFLTAPLREAYGADATRRMIFTGLHEAFVTYLKLALFAGLFASLPLALNQLWKFLAPGLYGHERASLRPLFVMTPLMFVAGAGLAYFVVLPLAWQFFLSFETPGAAAGMAIALEARVGEYLGLVMSMLIAFGLSFELPVLLLLLARLGVVDADDLVRYRRHAIVLIFAAAAVLTPPDFLSQIALGTPMLLLYELAIRLVRAQERAAAAAREYV